MLSTQSIRIKTSSEMRNMGGWTKSREFNVRIRWSNEIMRKNCTFGILSSVRWFYSRDLFSILSLSRGNSISSPLDISEWSPRMAVVQKWRQFWNHTANTKRRLPPKKGAIPNIRSMDGGFAVNEQNIECDALPSKYCSRMFFVDFVEFDIDHGFDSVPKTMAKHWMSISYCPPIAHSPFAYPLQWNRTTAHRAFVEWNVTNGLGQRDSASAYIRMGK